MTLWNFVVYPEHRETLDGMGLTEDMLTSLCMLITMAPCTHHKELEICTAWASYEDINWAHMLHLLGLLGSPQCDCRVKDVLVGHSPIPTGLPPTLSLRLDYDAGKVATEEKMIEMVDTIAKDEAPLYVPPTCPDCKMVPCHEDCDGGNLAAERYCPRCGATLFQGSAEHYLPAETPGLCSTCVRELQTHQRGDKRWDELLKAREDEQSNGQRR